MTPNLQSPAVAGAVSQPGRPKWRALLACVLISTLSLGLVGAAHADDRDDDDTYAIGLWGDLPYSAAQATVGVPNLIADMNAQRLKFTVHDGDLKAGSGSLCDNTLYAQALGYFNSLRAPAMFTPGDNDWTDCDRPSNGSFNSRERLDRERAVFFSSTYSMGQRRMEQEVQQGNLCLGVNGFVQCVENRRWTVGRVTYVTFNLPGSCNNLCDTAPDVAEYTARNIANLRWLKETFAQARDRKSSAVMIIAQANPGWDLSDPTRAPLRDPKTLVQTDGQPDGWALAHRRAGRFILLSYRRRMVAMTTSGCSMGTRDCGETNRPG